MTDPSNVVASLLDIATAGAHSARSLKEAAKRYKSRDATLRKLQSEVEDVENIMVALEQLLQAAGSQPALAADTSMPNLLRGPVTRCTEVCSKFKAAMAQFSGNGKSKTTIVDWAKMEFMRGSISEFIDNIAGYKATISVGLGVLTM